MKITLAIIPAFFALSAFGSPVEPNARQMPICNLAQCITTIGAQTAGNIPPCTAALLNLNNIQQAEGQGKPPSPADQSNLASNGLKCVATSIAMGFTIPAACDECPAPGIPS